MQVLGIIASYTLRLFDSFEDAAKAWDSIEEPLSDCPFFKRHWLELWQSTLGTKHGYDPAIAGLCSTTGEYLGILPFCSRKIGRLRQLEWMGAGVTDYGGPLLAKGFSFDQALLLAAATSVAKKQKCSIVCLERNPASVAGIPMPHVGKAFAECHYRAHSSFIGGASDPDPARMLSSKSRYNLRRAEKQLRELGKLEYLVASSQDQRDIFMAALVEHKRARYRATGARDPFDDSAFFSFFRQSGSVSGIPLHVSALLLDGAPIAEHWGVLDRDCLYLLMPSFEEKEYGPYSLGSLLVVNLLREGLCRGLGRVDFTVGDEDYKQRWCNEETRIFTLVFGLDLAGRAVSFWRLSLVRLKRGPWLPLLRRIRKRLILTFRKNDGKELP